MEANNNTKQIKEELDIFLVNYITKNNNSLGVSASNIHHFNRNIASESAIRGRLKALSNRKKLRVFRKAYTTRDDEIGYVNVYFKVEDN